MCETLDSVFCVAKRNTAGGVAGYSQSLSRSDERKMVWLQLRLGFSNAYDS